MNAWQRPEPEEYPIGYDLYQWKQPALVGCVLARPQDQAVAPQQNCAQNRSDGYKLLSMLYVIKPAVDLGENKAFPTSIQSCAVNANNEWYRFDAGVWKKESPLQTDASCPSLAYMIKNACKAQDGLPCFPQDSVEMTTLISDHLQFGAYFSLGRQYANQLVLDIKPDAENNVLSKVPACWKSQRCANTCSNTCN